MRVITRAAIAAGFLGVLVAGANLPKTEAEVATGVKPTPPVVQPITVPDPPKVDPFARNVALCLRAGTMCADGWAVTPGRATNEFGMSTLPATVRRTESTPLNGDDCVSGFLTLTLQDGGTDVGTMTTSVDHLCGQRAAKVDFVGFPKAKPTRVVLSGSAF